MPIIKKQLGNKEQVPTAIFGTGDIGINLATTSDGIRSIILHQDVEREESEFLKDDESNLGQASDVLKGEFIELVFTKKLSAISFVQQLMTMIGEMELDELNQDPF